MFQNSIEDYEDFVITCVPNPFFDQAIINIEKNNNRALLFDLYDSFGKKIWKESKIIENEKSFVINDLATGIYYFRVTNLNYVRIIPIMVLK